MSPNKPALNDEKIGGRTLLSLFAFSLVHLLVDDVLLVVHQLLAELLNFVLVYEFLQFANIVLVEDHSFF